MELVSATKVIQNLEDGYGSPTALKTLSVSLLKKASKVSHVCDCQQRNFIKTNRFL